MEFLGSVGNYLKYYTSLHENVKSLDEIVRKLNDKKKEIETRLRRAEQLGKKSKEEVNKWRKNVERINTETEDIKKNVGEKWFCSRARLGKLIEKKIQDANELIQRSSFPDGLVVSPVISGVPLPRATSISKTTAKKYVNEIWAYLMDERVRMIGVSGMKGVGKTIIMQHIKNQLLQVWGHNVIWVTVSKELDVIKIQNDIAGALKQDLPIQEDKTKRAEMLSKMLENERFVLILDDVWETFSLKEVGIPEPSENTGSKIMLTTRSSNVCRSMNCETVKVGPLTKEEAWDLFLDEVGIDVSKIPNLEVIMKLVADQCACMPLAILKVARDMKGVNDIDEWRNVLKEFRERIKAAKGIEFKVSERLKFNHDHLKDFKVQRSFLFCKLYPEGFEIPKRELIEHWIAEGLVDKMTSREAEYNRGHDLLKTLEESCLLESTNNEGSVKIRDQVKDMAVSMARANPHFMAKAAMQLKQIPNVQEYWTDDLEKVSLMRNSISEISSKVSPDCQRLSTLLLQHNPLKNVENSFFKGMSGLRVLDLSYTDISTLPESISDLGNLTTLLLRQCWALKSMPSLAKLGALKTLDLRYTGIEVVPQGMEMLANLRFLNLCAKDLKVLPIGILPKLRCLQCLIVWWGSDTLKVKGEEVAGLRVLETLVGQFYDLHDFNMYVKHLQHRGPRRFHLQLGPGDPYSIDNFIDFEEEGRPFSKHIRLEGCKLSDRGGVGDALLLPNDIEFLSIEKCNDVSSLSDVSSLKKADSLKYCEISNCNGIEYLLRSSCNDPFESLEVLLLTRLEKLLVLFGGEGASASTSASAPASASESAPPLLPACTFSCLRQLCIHECPIIKMLFTLTLMPQLQKLEEIRVYYCEGMEEIIAGKEEGEEQGMGESKITLPNLRLLFLSNLPELKTIVYSKGIMVCDSLQQISICNCPKLKRLALSLPMSNGQLYRPPNLKHIYVDNEEWWKSLEWDSPTAKDVLNPLVGRGHDVPKNPYTLVE